MKILLTAIGTQGDVEPFLATGKILKEKGHQVICAFSEQFRNLTESCDLEFYSLGRKLYDLNDSEFGRIIMGGGKGMKKTIAFFKLAVKSGAANKEKESLLYELIQKEQPDKILYNSKTTCPIIWERNNPGTTIFLSPYPYLHYVEGHPMLVFRKNYGAFINKLTFKLYSFGAGKAAKNVKKGLGIHEKISRKQLTEIVDTRKFIYTISPDMFPRQDHWDSNVHVLGYHELKRKTNWEPEIELLEFIEKNEKIVFVTFGSMPNTEPEYRTKVLLDILERNKIPAIINTAAGGLLKPGQFNSELIYFVSQVPYDWFFPKMYAVIQHGGSGTTHLALNYGCATMAIPHFIDQFVWDTVIPELGVGPRGLNVSRMTVKNLEPKILDLLTDRSFKENSERFGKQMFEKDYKEELYKTIIE
jgi:UDP:flavonoid glycosyltransferase YjiC (YdhE family)